MRPTVAKVSPNAGSVGLPQRARRRKLLPAVHRRGTLPRVPPPPATAHDLAIVVPAYKGRFLERTLQSIAAQDDRRFRLYVADDGSPDRIGEIVAPFATTLGERLVFRRFDDNLGGRSLTGHWTRAIALSDEPWVWLFSDDDVMEPGSVAAFRAARAATGDAFDVYRFNSIIVDDDERVVALCPPHPERERWCDLAYHLLSGWRRVNQQEMVFRRAALQRIGGFLDLPLAWFSDHAFALAAAAATGVCTIQGPRLRFRQSGANLSSRSTRALDVRKQAANEAYVDWLLGFVEQHDCGEFPGRDVLRALAKQTYLQGLWVPRRWVGLGQARGVLRFMRQRLGMSRAESLARLCFYNATAPIVRGKSALLQGLLGRNVAGRSSSR